MIITDLPIESPDFFNVSNYIWKGAQKVEGGNKPELIMVNGLTIDEIGSPKSIAAVFEERWNQRKYRGKNANAFYHTIFSWDPKDEITNNALEDIIQKYFSLRNDGDTLAYAGIHRDKEHTHVHVMMSATGSDNRSIRMSKAEFKNMKEIVWNYQREHYPTQTKHSYDHIKPKFDRQNKKKSRGERILRAKDQPLIKRLLDMPYEGCSNFVEYLLKSKDAESKMSKAELQSRIANQEKGLSERGKVAYKFRHLLRTNEYLPSLLSKGKQLDIFPFLDRKTNELKGVWHQGKSFTYSRMLSVKKDRDRFKNDFRVQLADYVRNQEQLEHLLAQQREQEMLEREQEFTR